MSENTQRPTAKRSPSILVTDARKNTTKAPFAGHHYSYSQRNPSGAKTPVSPYKIPNRTRNHSKYSDISVTNLLSNTSDIPSSRQRPTGLLSAGRPRSYRSMGRDDGYEPGLKRLPSGSIPKLAKTLPLRTSKTSERLVMIPDHEIESFDEYHRTSTTENVFTGDLYVRTKAEQMSKEQREEEYSRVTAYLIADGFDLKLTSKFLAKHHSVSPRVYDEVLYIPYSLPLLPGENGYRVQSNNSLKMQKGNMLMENFINKSEQKDHHFEYFSGVDYTKPHPPEREHSNLQVIEEEGHAISPHLSSSNFDPYEPQFFASQSPTDSMVETTFTSREEIKTKEGIEVLLDTPQAAADQEGAHAEASSSASNGADSSGSRSPASRSVPDLSKHAEIFIFDYGVVVFWNFSEVHEKNVLADLVFAKIQPGEFGDSDDEDEEDDDESGSGDDEQDNLIQTHSQRNEEEKVRNISFIIKPVREQDIETEEFHFEYNRDIATPRIYNDMITLKSGDHMIKLAISHAIAQSTKLSIFESKMSGILASISKLPKTLALTGKLENYTRKKLLMKTGKLFYLRNAVNLSSNVLDTPDYFWSIEPGLDPLYSAIREYLEIEQRVEVIEDRCKVFLEFFDIIADSLAEKTMNKITTILIVAIGLMLLVTSFEVVIRYVILSKGHPK
ncbi:unnamed protein product [Kuraishia capsulata CBS 1993]|uniref:DUF155 domain-containing protein n=1 Tax=Kuraishia capsulata CBS 1993 TaxID=1382522 RepID=W6MLE8_9ASCO|nr:uncharacterized protein KUCA_T00001597001 [Kuraishia capsulata CBS 1993]CDK25627.1 unnamed protein product [Kuraishia capsulata CBS 1993]